MRDRKVWIFNAGASFDGNPKWLFLYLVHYRKDIEPYWFCYTKSSRDSIRKLGYQAYCFDSKEAAKIGARAGVYVVNQFKEVFQDYLDGITILNLWHGVGCKTVEKKVDTGILNDRIAKKYIQYGDRYQKYGLFLVSSPLMEEHFKVQCGLKEKNIIRAGYPCCIYPDQVATFDHDFLQGRNLPADTKIAVYAPTYRDACAEHFFGAAIPDMEKLVATLERNHFVLIFKLHPKMMDDFEYKNIATRYKDNPWLIFWNNDHDFYEVMDRVDFAIVDYSSIFYDMIERGIRNFARYIFDYDAGAMRDFALDYMSHTCGTVVRDFDALCQLFENEAYKTNPAELAGIRDAFWHYSNENSLETIVNAALNFTPDENDTLPNFYSFDIFDTLLGRKTLSPGGVFRYVQDQIKTSDLGFSKYVSENYTKIRAWAEANAREYYNKSVEYRQEKRTEITFDMIFDRIQDVYGVTDIQRKALQTWELECEYETSIPLPKIQDVKRLLLAGENVVLISDMYLPKEFVQRLLRKADPLLTELPLFLSSDIGTQKSKRDLFVDVYHAVDYAYANWYHYGDSKTADGTIPNWLGIQTFNHEVPKFDRYENALTNFSNTYDAYLVSGLLTRFRESHSAVEDVYAYCYVSLYWVPYLSWTIEDAIRCGTKCLYFISRDGYHLKRIADALIDARGLSIRTRYIYGSRKAWRIPSQCNGIDEEFFGPFGNFVGVSDYTTLLEAAGMTEDTFAAYFPELLYLKDKKDIPPEEMDRVKETFSLSQKYREYLRAYAQKESEIVLAYLRQEIDFTEPYAFVEYWGRGYTQTCLQKLLQAATGHDEEVAFYYARSIYPTQGNCIRYNFTGNNYSMIFIESIFANLPYETVKRYQVAANGKIEPVLTTCENNAAIHQSLCRYLPEFARDYAALPFLDEANIRSVLFDFGLSFFHRNKRADIFLQTLATLQDAVGLFDDKVEYARGVKTRDILKWLGGGHFYTKDFGMSFEKSGGLFQKAYRFYCLHVKETWLERVINQFRALGK